MTPKEIKQILLLRRGPSDDRDPQVAEAHAQVKNDPELRAWFQAHEQFQSGMRSAFRQLPVPEGLANRIMAHAPAVRLPWWSRFPAWASAAAAILAISLVASQWRPSPGDSDSFITFRSRMVRSVLRQYQMDIETNNMAAIRVFLNTNGAPADYELKGKLDQLAPRGAGLQSWRGQRVAMVCLDSGGLGTAILFVVTSGSVGGPPPPAPDFSQVSKLMTVSWSSGGRAYLLMIDNTKVDRTQLEKLL